MRNRVVIVSDKMSSAAYDSTTAVLEVEFSNGYVYEYLGVPRDHYDALLAAPSKGRYFNNGLRGKFLHRRRVFAG